MKGKLSDRQENNQERHNQQQLSISTHQPTPPQQADESDSSAPLHLNITPSQGVRRPSHGTLRISPPSQEMYRRQLSTAFPPTTALPTSRFSSTTRRAPMPRPPIFIGAPYRPRVTPGQLSISDHQQKLPPPPPQPQQAEATPDLAFSYFCYQPTQPPPQPQQAEATPDLAFSYFCYQPTQPPPQPQQAEATPDLVFSYFYYQPTQPPPPPLVQPKPSHATPRNYPRFQETDQQCSTVPSLLGRLSPKAQLQTFQNKPHKNYEEPIVPPHRWATTCRAGVHPFADLLLRNINPIEGYMQCIFCGETYEMHYDLREKFTEFENSINGNNFTIYTTLLKCMTCLKEQSVMPMIEMKKRHINWLFLFLGKWIVCCTDEPLKYFCKHNGYDQQGSREQLIYRTYMGLYQQLLHSIR